MKGLDSQGFTYASWIAQSIAWTTSEGIPIVNMGVAMPVYDCVAPCTGPPITPESAEVMNAACLNGLYAGQFLTAAMGNCNQQLPFFPAYFASRTYAVGALALDGRRWEDYNLYPPYCSFPYSCCGSAYGQWIDAIAPGGRYIATLDQGPNGLNAVAVGCQPNPTFPSAFGGTSAAISFVSGVAALLKSYNPTLLGEDIAEILNRTAIPLPFDPAPSPYSGHGRVNAAAALDFIAPPRALLHHTIGYLGTNGTLAVRESTVTSRIFYHVPGLPPAPYDTYDCTVYRLAGRAFLNDGFSSPPVIWVRASGTMGWRDTVHFEYNEEVRWGRVVGPVSALSDSFETFVYRIIDPDNPGTSYWYPDLLPES